MKLQREFETELKKYRQNGKEFQEELLGEQKRLVHLYTSRIRSAVEQVAMREGLDLVLDELKDFKPGKDLLSPAVKELLKTRPPGHFERDRSGDGQDVLTEWQWGKSYGLHLLVGNKSNSSEKTDPPCQFSCQRHFH